MTWRVATVKDTRDETATARTITLDAPGWPGHQPGQHVAVKLTAADGYSAQRDYSIASASAPGSLELTVQRVDDGEVSAYLAETAEPGDQFELRGPIGGWFAWHEADPHPLLLLAGGSGIVPLMSMIRTHAQASSQVPVRLLYSARTPADIIYATELSQRQRVSPLTVTYLYTRATSMPPAPQTPAPQTPAPVTPGPRITAPGARHQSAPGPGIFEGSNSRPSTAGTSHGRWLAAQVYAGRLNDDVLALTAFPPHTHPAIFVCGPSGFVETASALLVAAGHAPATIKTERFGPSS